MTTFDLSKYIDKVVYINLDKRTDRRLEIETQLKEYGITFERFAAIPHSNGIVGCGYSHLKVLSIAREWEYTPLNISNGTPEGLPKGARDSMATLPINELGFRNAKPIGLRPQLKGNPPLEDCPISNLHRCKNILILEDDFVFAVSKEEFQRQIEKMFEYNTLLPYDVIMISYTKHGIQQKEELDHPILNRLIEAQNASGYIVNSHYYSKLIELYETNIPLLEQTGQHWIYANDIIWKRLQCVDRWFYCKQRIGKQRAGFSDNTNSFADYEV